MLTFAEKGEAPLLLLCPPLLHIHRVGKGGFPEVRPSWRPWVKEGGVSLPSQVPLPRSDGVQWGLPE